MEFHSGSVAFNHWRAYVGCLASFKVLEAESHPWPRWNRNMFPQKSFSPMRKGKSRIYLGKLWLKASFDNVDCNRGFVPTIFCKARFTHNRSWILELGQSQGYYNSLWFLIPLRTSSLSRIILQPCTSPSPTPAEWWIWPLPLSRMFSTPPVHGVSDRVEITWQSFDKLILG